MEALAFLLVGSGCGDLRLMMGREGNRVAGTEGAGDGPPDVDDERRTLRRGGPEPELVNSKTERFSFPEKLAGLVLFSPEVTSVVILAYHDSILSGLIPTKMDLRLDINSPVSSKALLEKPRSSSSGHHDVTWTKRRSR